MNREAFIQKTEYRPEKDPYRSLYVEMPEAYAEPVEDWDGFCERVRGLLTGREASLSEKNLQLIGHEEAPTPMGELLTEREFIPAGEEVGVILNAPYCPAFWHSLEFIKLIYVFRGGCIFYTEEVEYRLWPGDICLVAPGVRQTVFSSHEEDIVLNLLVRGSTFEEAFPELLEMDSAGRFADFFWRMLYHKPGGEILRFKGAPQEWIEEDVIDLYEESTRQEKRSNLIMKSLLLSVFAHILRYYEPLLPAGYEAGRPFMLPRYLSYMKQNLETVSLRSLALEMGKSEGYLSRYFRKETGCTFSSLLREMRMKRAGELLLRTECDIARVVELVGYTDQSIFFRNFKQYYGMTPANYRRRKGVNLFQFP